MQQDLTPKQQTSEAVRQAETILITSGQNPTVDQVTAALALSAVLRKFGKKTSVIISDPLPREVAFLDTAAVSRELSGLRDFIMKVDLAKAEVDKLRYEVQDGKLNVYITPFQGGFAPTDVTYGYGDYHFDLAIVLGVPMKNRIDRVFGDNQSLFSSIPVINLDYHRSNENYGAVNLIEPTASSLCEILVALSESLQTGLIDADIATIMLAGLMSSTDRFTAGHTTSKSMTVAAQLMAAGARQQAVVKGLYQPAPAPRQEQRVERTDRPVRNDRQAADRPQSGRPDNRQDNRNQPARAQDQPRRNEPVKPDENELRAAIRTAQAASAQAQVAAQPTAPASSAAPAERPAPRLTENDPFAATPIVPAFEPETAAPVTAQEEPIINPAHIELSRVEDVAPSTPEAPQEVPAMADFAAAAQMLRRDEQASVTPSPAPQTPQHDGDVNPPRDRV